MRKGHWESYFASITTISMVRTTLRAYQNADDPSRVPFALCRFSRAFRRISRGRGEQLFCRRCVALGVWTAIGRAPNCGKCGTRLKRIDPASRPGDQVTAGVEDILAISGRFRGAAAV